MNTQIPPSPYHPHLERYLKEQNLLWLLNAFGSIAIRPGSKLALPKPVRMTKNNPTRKTLLLKKLFNDFEKLQQ